jgi:hypothetical protein
MSEAKFPFRPIYVPKYSPPVCGPLRSPAKAIAEELAKILAPARPPKTTPVRKLTEWEKARDAILAYRAAGNNFPGERLLSRKVGFTKKSTHTALTKCGDLRQWRADSERAVDPIAEPLDDNRPGQIEPWILVADIGEAEYGEAMKRIMEAAKPAELDEFLAKSDADRRSLAACLIQQERESDVDCMGRRLRSSDRLSHRLSHRKV